MVAEFIPELSMQNQMGILFHLPPSLSSEWFASSLGASAVD
jgi:hypothetical protein